jgi:hypothetical protein
MLYSQARKYRGLPLSAGRALVVISMEEGEIDDADLLEKAFLTDSSKRAEGVPAIASPLFSLRFLTNPFPFQIYWNKPCAFREVWMSCLRRFFLRCRGSHVHQAYLL